MTKREWSAYGYGNDGFDHDQWIVVEHWLNVPGDVLEGCTRREAGPFVDESQADAVIAFNETSQLGTIHSSRKFKRHVTFTPWEAT